MICENGFGAPLANSIYGQTLAESVALGQFYTFTVAPTPGRTLALTPKMFSGSSLMLGFLTQRAEKQRAESL
jgi:hypothetical protein